MNGGPIIIHLEAGNEHFRGELVSQARRASISGHLLRPSMTGLIVMTHTTFARELG